MLEVVPGFALLTVRIVNYASIIFIFSYLVFGAVLLWQLRLLISSVRTNLSNPILVLGICNLLVAFLILVTALGLL